MNSYELSRNYFDWCFENPEKITPNHTAIYFFAVEHCNRLGWKDKFGLPSQMVMDAIGIKNWRTYIKAFNDLTEWGFFELVEKSKNQYSSNIIAIVKNTKATTKALDKAMQMHLQKQGQSIVSIDKHINNITINNKQADALMIEKFLLWFNDMKFKYKKVEGKFKTLSKTDLNNLKSLKTLGYTAEDFEHAYKVMIDSIWTKENHTDVPRHFLVNDNFSKYVNTVVSNQSKVQPYG
jgi:hypothetical protein